MQPFDLVKRFCPEKIRVMPGAMIGYGFHGSVYDIPGESEKVIKFSLVTECMAQSLQVLDFYKNVREVLALQSRHDYIHYVKVFEHELLYSGQRTIHSNVKQNFILYSAIMEKLMPLSHDEDKLFKTVCDAIGAGKSGAHIKQLISEQSNWLNFNLNRCQIFLDQIERSVIIHGDFQRQNVMKDALGNFKLIDFDFSKIKEPTYEASRSECAE